MMRKFVGFLLMNASETWPVHRAKSTKQWHKKNRVHLQGWPGNSPDLNPIESHAESRTSNIDSWSETNRFEGLKEHHSINLRSYYESMPCRMLAVVVAEGGHTKY